MPVATLDVCLSPLLFHLYDVKDKNVVVIDILRATSTICTALHHGAKAVVPVTTIEECLSYKNENTLLACEREGKIAEGFVHGNSPMEYTEDIIKDKLLVLTTTNGTRCINMSRGARNIVAGSFLNLNAIVEFLSQEKRDTILFCSGWKDQFSLEDTLFAGAVVDRLAQEFNWNNDPAFSAFQLYQSAKSDLLAFVKNSSHYQRLAAHGVSKDIAFCMNQSLFNLIPILNSKNQLIISPNHE